VSYQTLTKIRAADAITPPTAPIGAAAAPLTASGNGCAQNWLSGFLATATNRCRNRFELVSNRKRVDESTWFDEREGWPYTESEPNFKT